MQIVREIPGPTGDRKATLYRRADGSFGFDAWYWADDVQSWCPTRGFGGCRTDSLERAEAEARSRVPWLAGDDP